MNLVENARDAGAQGMTIGLRHSSDGPVVTVTDDGPRSLGRRNNQCPVRLEAASIRGIADNCFPCELSLRRKELGPFRDRQGIVHGHLDPSGVLVTSSGEAKLLDLAASPGERTWFGAAGAPVAAWLSPEQRQGMGASVRYHRLEDGVRSMQGWLETRHLAEGAAALRFVTTPWLTLHTGPQIRRYETPSGAERWVTWQLGARAEAPIVASSVRGHAMWWGGPVLSLNVPPLVSGTTLGGELGVTVDMTRGPFWFGLAYGIDQASVQGTTRRETVKTLTIAAGLRRP